MMISNYLSSNRLNNKILLKLIAFFSLVGFADTIYLTAGHYLGTGIKCVILKGCDVVLLSKYSEIFGVPVALIGLFFYIGIFVLVSFADVYQSNIISKLLIYAGALGFTVSLVLVYIQVFVIKALCFYCLASAGSSTAIFIMAIVIYNNKKINQPILSEDSENIV